MLYWNPFFSEFFTEDSLLSKTATGFDARLISLSTVCALMVANSSFFESQRFGATTRIDVRATDPQGLSVDPLRSVCWLLIGTTIVTALMASAFQSNWTIGCLVLVGVANGLLFVSANPDLDNRFCLPVKQLVQTSILFALVVALLVKKTETFSSLNSAYHPMLQFGVLSIALALAHRGRAFIGWGEWKWLSRLVSIAFLGWFAFGVGNQCAVELVANYSGDVSGWLDLNGAMWWLVLTGAVVFCGQLLNR